MPFVTAALLGSKTWTGVPVASSTVIGVPSAPTIGDPAEVVAPVMTAELPAKPVLEYCAKSAAVGRNAWRFDLASIPALVTLIACTCKSGRLANASFTASSNVAASTASGGLG